MTLLTLGTLFVCALGSALTILAYKFQKSSRRIVIPSSYLFLDFPEKKSKGKIYFPPRLILELLFIFLIAISIILIGEKNSEERELVIFNNSLSMSTMVGSESKTTRLDLAKKSFIQNATSDKKYKLRVLPNDFSKSGDSELDQFEDLSVVLKKISEIKGSTSAETLASNFEQLYLQSVADKVSIYSDKEIAFSGSDGNKIAAVNVGVKAPNVYIADVEVAQSSISEIKLDAKIGFSGEGSTKGQVEIYSVSNTVRAEKKLLQKKEYFVQSDATSNVNFTFDPRKISAESSAGFLIKIASSLQNDSNYLDSIAYAVVEARNRGRIFLVSDDSGLEQIASSLKTASRLEVEIISSKTYQSRTKDGDAAIFYRTKFPEKFNGPSLVVLPNSEDKNLEFLGVAKNTKVTSYANNSPLTRYVAFDTLQFPQTLVFKQSSWANGFIYSKSGPIALSGILDSKYVTVLGFEVLPFDKERKSASDVLLLNILTTLQANQNYRISNQVKNQGNLICVTEEFDCQSQETSSEKGLYQDGNSEVYTAVNNFNSTESDTYSTHTLTLKTPENSLGFSAGKSADYIPFTLWGALIVLIFDLMLVIFKGREVSWREEG